MAVVAEELEIGAAPDQIWEWIADLSKWPEWNAVHNGFPDGEPELTEGATFKQKVKIMGMPGEVAWTVDTVEPNSKLALSGKGPMGTSMRMAYDLEPAGDGTRVAYEAEYGGAALAAMAGPLEKESKKSAAESLDRLKNALGNGAG